MVIVVAMIVMVIVVVMVTMIMVVMSVPTWHLQGYHIEFVYILRLEFQYMLSLFKMEDHNHGPSWAP